MFRFGKRKHRGILERVIKKLLQIDICTIFSACPLSYQNFFASTDFQKQRDFLHHKSIAIEDTGILAVTMFSSRFRLI